jgi:hypothetical protein
MERRQVMRLHASIKRLGPALVAVAFAASLTVAAGMAPSKEEPPGFVARIRCPPPDAIVSIAPGSFIPAPDC